MTAAIFNLKDNGNDGDFRIEQGTYWQVGLTLEDEQGEIFDLQNFDEFRCQLLNAAGDTVVWSPAVLRTGQPPGSDGLLRLSLTATETQTMPETSGVWSLEARDMASPDTTSRAFLKGTWEAILETSSGPFDE